MAQATEYLRWEGILTQSSVSILTNSHYHLNQTTIKKRENIMAQTRAEHLQWCKERALEYLNPGEFFSIDQAMASMQSDMGKHPETRNHMALGLMLQMRISGNLDTAEKMAKFINDFN